MPSLDYEFQCFICWDVDKRESFARILVDEYGTGNIGFALLEWDVHSLSRNLRRIYGLEAKQLEKKASSIKERLIVFAVVKDIQPMYKSCLTTTGYRMVNQKSHKCKKDLRKKLGGNFVVHSSDTSQEAQRDIFLVSSMDAKACFESLLEANQNKTYPVFKCLLGDNGIHTNTHTLMQFLTTAADAAVVTQRGSAAFYGNFEITFLASDFYDLALLANSLRFPLFRAGNIYETCVYVDGVKASIRIVDIDSSGLCPRLLRYFLDRSKVQSGIRFIDEDDRKLLFTYVSTAGKRLKIKSWGFEYADATYMVDKVSRQKDLLNLRRLMAQNIFSPPSFPRYFSQDNFSGLAVAKFRYSSLGNLQLDENMDKSLIFQRYQKNSERTEIFCFLVKKMTKQSAIFQKQSPAIITLLLCVQLFLGESVDVALKTAALMPPF